MTSEPDHREAASADSRQCERKQRLQKRARPPVRRLPNAPQFNLKSLLAGMTAVSVILASIATSNPILLGGSLLLVWVACGVIQSYLLLKPKEWTGEE